MKNFTHFLMAMLFMAGISTNAFAQPGNDNFCASAPGSSYELVVNAMFCGGGATNADNTGATAELAFNEPTISCAVGGEGGIPTHSIWFSFVPTSTQVSVSTNFPGSGTNDDTQLIVFEDNGTAAACPTPDMSNLEEVACNDDVSGTNFLSELACVNVTPGNTYYIMVDGWDEAQGSFCIEVADAVPPVSCSAVPVFVDFQNLVISPGPIRECANTIGWPINDDPAVMYIPFAPSGTDGPYEVSLTGGTGNLYESTPIPTLSNPIEALDDFTIAFLGVTQADVDNAPGGVHTITFSSCGIVCSTFDITWATYPESMDVAGECPPPACDLFGEVSLGTTCTSLTEFVVDVTIGAGATGTAYTITNDQNAESLNANGPGTYSFTTPVAQGTDVIVTVTQDMPVEPGCVASATITAADCSCFGSEPANDECANAISLPLAADISVCTPTPVTTECASQSAIAPSCSPSWYDDDVWFSVDVPAGFSGDGINVLSIFGAGAIPITDNGVAVYDACGGTELGCYSAVGVSELFIDVTLFTPPATLIIRTWSAGNTPADQGTYEICAHVVDCQITSIVAGTQGSCNPVDQTYTQDVIITYSGNVTAGDLTVNGQSFPIETSPQTVTLTGLPADDLNPPVDVTASFALPAGCSLTATGLFNAPSTCVPLTCADGPFSFCYGNGASGLTVGEVCPANPGETVRIAFGASGVEAGFDTLSVYSGTPGSGTSGTLISANLTGGLSGLVFESAVDECIILVMDSDGSVSCDDGSLDPVQYDCFSNCGVSSCFFPSCSIAPVLPDLPVLNQFPETFMDLAWNGVSPPVTTGASNEFEVCGVITYTGTTGEGGTFTHAALSNEAGNIDVIECAAGIVSSELYPVGPLGIDCSNPLTPDLTDPDTYTGLTQAANYVFCVTYNILTDFTNPDTDGATEGTCNLYGIAVAFTPTECFADAGTFTNDNPSTLLCFGDMVTFTSNGDWANPFGSMSGDQTPPAGVIFGLWDATAPSGGFPLDDMNFLDALGSEPAGTFGPPELVNDAGGNSVVFIAPIAASDETNGEIGTDLCFDVNETGAVSYILLDEITGDPSLVCNAASTGFDVTLSNVVGGIPGFSMSGIYIVTDDAGGPGDPAVPFNGSYTVLNAAPGTTVTFTISDGICSQDVPIDVPDLTPPELDSNDPYCISDLPDLITLDQPTGDFGTFELTIVFDQFPEETGFQVLDNAGTVVVEALPGSFTGLANCPGFIFTLGPFNTNDGPFDLVMIDDFGDGMNSNDGVCFGTTCGPGGFGLVDTGTGTELIMLGLFPGEDSDGDACDAIDPADIPVAPQGIADVDGDGDPDQTLTFTGLALTPVTAAATFAGLGISDNLDGSASFDPSLANIGTNPVAITWTNNQGCAFNFTEMLTVEANSIVSGNGVSTWADLVGGGQAFPPVNPPTYIFDTGVLSNECVLSPGIGTIQGLVAGEINKPGEVEDLDLTKALCTGALSFSNAPVFYTLKTDPVDDPVDGAGDQLNLTVIPIANGKFSQMNVALYGPLIPGSRMFPEAGASFIECEQGNGTNPTLLTANGLPPNTLYLVIVDTDGGTQRTGNFSIQGQGTALPLELTSFTGRAEGAVNILDWTTASESGSDYFSVERSVVSADNFEEIGRVQAAGFSSSALAYQFEDSQPGLESYYRLRMIDLDGIANFSDVIFIKRAITSFSLTGIFPNPAREGVSVLFESPTADEIELSVTDVLGRVVYAERFNPATGGNIKEVDLSAYPTGLYFISLRYGLERYIRKVVKE